MSYGPESVQVLKDAEHIRARPGMYIGDTGTKGLHHLVYELIYNSVDEALAGHCKIIHVEIGVDGSLSVSDDGRGIPVEVHKKTGKSTLEVVLTTVGAGAKFDHGAYKVSAGLHGMGAKAVTALSEWTEAEVRRNGNVYVQEYERGRPITEVTQKAKTNQTGTKITFKPDPEIFHDTKFDFETLENRFRELAFLNKGLAIELLDNRTGRQEKFLAVDGVREYVQYMNRSDETIHDILYVDKLYNNVRVEIAFQYTIGEEERIRCYANNAYNPGGGTHLSGFRTAITRALTSYGKKEDLFKRIEPISEDFREGITAIVSVAVPEPQFESQTKIKLNNPEVDGIVSAVLYEYLTNYLEENPKEATRLIKKVIIAAEAREAAQKAKRTLKDRKNILSGGGMPGKLMDCTTRNRDESELFLVEGGSAGGSADNGRNRFNQAILPLRGKVLNVEKARVERVITNEELASLIAAIGIDIGNTEDIEKVRYGKIIILTDADVDGQHIRTLILTFFFRQMRKLIEGGRIFVARPPLFKISQKGQIRYVQTISEMSDELVVRGLENTKFTVNKVEYTGDKLEKLLDVITEIDDSLIVLERRGFNIPYLFSKIKGNKLPTFYANGWHYNRKEVADTVVQEMHEIKVANYTLQKLTQFSLDAKDMLPSIRVAGRELAAKFVIASEGKIYSIGCLRNLVDEIRKIGERGIKIVRFKGLGEMDGEELWDTTLDPQRRTLLKVQIEDAVKADEMFRCLMGEKVEPRREFIYKHALDSKVDYHSM